MPGIIKTNITDHCPIFCSIESSTLSKKSDQKFSKRDLQHFNSETFCENLHESLHNFLIKSGAINSHNFNEVCTGFIKVIEKTIDLQHAPLKKWYGKEHKLRLKLWISRSLLTCIKHKQKLYITHFLKGNLEQQIHYKQNANKLNKTKIAAKKQYYETELKKAQNDSYKTWNIIKSLLPSSRKDSAFPDKLTFHGNINTDSRGIAKAFND